MKFFFFYLFWHRPWNEIPRGLPPSGETVQDGLARYLSLQTNLRNTIKNWRKLKTGTRSWLTYFQKLVLNDLWNFQTCIFTWTTARTSGREFCVGGTGGRRQKRWWAGASDNIWRSFGEFWEPRKQRVSIRWDIRSFARTGQHKHLVVGRDIQSHQSLEEGLRCFVITEESVSVHVIPGKCRLRTIRATKYISIYLRSKDWTI